MVWKIDRIRIASGVRERARGLLRTNRDDLEFDALMLAPCRSIHTLGMRYSIDVAFLGRDGTVLRTARAIPPHKLVVRCSGAWATIERPADDKPWPREGERVHLGISWAAAPRTSTDPGTAAEFPRS